MNEDKKMNVLVIGVSGAGKSTLIKRYKEYKQHEHGLKMVDFKKLMNMLIG